MVSGLVKIAVIGLLAGIALAMSDVLLKFAWGIAGCPIDTTVGMIEHVGPDALASRLEGKTALVVGATRGIGRGIAITLAKAGANVQIVGRSEQAGAAVVASMVAGQRSNTQVFKFRSHDLFTVKGCSRLVNDLQEEGALFDYVVFTVGMWPDYNNPKTSDGVDKVFALDVLARFTILQGVHPLLSSDARVLSVLASTTWMVLPSVEQVKMLITGESAPRLGGFEMLPVAAVTADAVLQLAAARSPDVRFVGTQPGLVSTEVVRSTFPSWLSDILERLISVVSISEEESGDMQVNILSSPNLKHRQVSYVDPVYQARETNSLAYDQEFSKWLWNFLESTVAKYK